MADIRPCGELLAHLPRFTAADTASPCAGCLTILTLKAAVEGLLRVKAQRDRHVQNRFIAVGQALNRFLQLLRANIFGERGAGMLFEKPLEVPFRIAGSPGDGFNVQTAIEVVVDPVE